MEKVVSNSELYERIVKLEDDISEIKDILLHVQYSTEQIRKSSRSVAEQFGINVVSNILADELIFRPLRIYRGEIQ